MPCWRTLVCAVIQDPSERDELSAAKPSQKKRMMAALTAALPGVIQTPMVPDDAACCRAAEQDYGGFLGPFMT